MGEEKKIPTPADLGINKVPTPEDLGLKKKESGVSDLDVTPSSSGEASPTTGSSGASDPIVEGTPTQPEIVQNPGSFTGYLQTYAAGFNEGLAGIFNLLDKAQTKISQDIGNMLFGEEVSKAMGNLPGARPFKAVADVILSANKDVKIPTDEEGKPTMAAQVIQSVGAITPDIMTAHLFPAVKTGRFLAKYGIKSWDQFAVYLGGKEGLTAGVETEGKNLEDLTKPIIAGAKGFQEGLMFQSFGKLSTGLGNAVTKKLFGEATDIGSKITGGTIGTLGNALLFGGYAGGEEYLRTGEVTAETVLNNIGIGIGLGIQNAIVGGTVNSFVALDRASLKRIKDNPTTAKEMRKKADELVKEAEAETDPQKKEELLAFAALATNLSGTKALVETVVESPEKINLIIDESKFPDGMKEELKDKVDAVAADNDPRVQESKPFIEEMASNTEKVKQIQNNKSLSDADKQAQITPLTEKNKELQEKVNEVYGIKPEKPVEKPVEEPKTQPKEEPKAEEVKEEVKEPITEPKPTKPKEEAPKKPAEKPPDDFKKQKQQMLDRAEENNDYEILSLIRGSETPFGKEVLGAVLKSRVGEPMSLREHLLIKTTGLTEKEIAEIEAIPLEKIFRDEVFNNSNANIQSLGIPYARRLEAELDFLGIEHQGEKTKLSGLEEKISQAKGVQPKPEPTKPKEEVPPVKTEPKTPEIEGIKKPKEVKVKQFAKDTHTKGIFQDEQGNLYKSTTTLERTIKDNKVQEKELGTSDEYELLKDNQDLTHLPVVGEKIMSSMGEVFGIEKLNKISKGELTFEEYQQLENTLHELNKRGIEYMDNATVMRRSNGEVVLVDLSSAQRRKGEITPEQLGYKVDELLSKDDQSRLNAERQAEHRAELKGMLEDVKGTETHDYYLTRRPPSIGTHPIGTVKDPAEAPHPSRKGRTAWVLSYDRPLTSKEIAKFELTPKVGIDEVGKIYEGKFGKDKAYFVVANVSEDGVLITRHVGGKSTEKTISQHKYFQDFVDNKNVTLKTKQDAKKQQSRKVRKEGDEAGEKQVISDKDLPEGDKAKLQDREKPEEKVEEVEAPEPVEEAPVTPAKVIAKAAQAKTPTVSVKEQKKDLLGQIDDVIDRVVGKDDKASFEKLKKEGLASLYSYVNKAKIKELQDAGYKVEQVDEMESDLKGGRKPTGEKVWQITFDIEGDGTFKLNLNTLSDSRAIVQKNYPTSEKQLPKKVKLLKGTQGGGVRRDFSQAEQTIIDNYWEAVRVGNKKTADLFRKKITEYGLEVPPSPQKTEPKPVPQKPKQETIQDLQAKLSKREITQKEYDKQAEVIRLAERKEAANKKISEGVDELTDAMGVKKKIIYDGNPLEKASVYEAVLKIADGLSTRVGIKAEELIRELKDKLKEYKITGAHIDKYRDRILKDVGLADRFKDAVKDTEKQQKDLIETTNKKNVRDYMRDFIFDRRKEISLASFKTNLFVHHLNKNLSKAQRELMPFLLEKTDVPDALQRPDLQELHKTDRAQLEPYVKEVRKYFDETWERIVANTDKLSADQIKDYVTHIWDIPNKKQADVVSWFATKNKFLKKRYIETLKEGIELFGLKPKHLDIGDIIKLHSRVSNSVIANNNFLKSVKILGRMGEPMILPANKAPSHWATIDHPALREITFKGGDGEKIVLGDVPLKVHPDLKGPMNVIFDRRITAEFRIGEREYDLIKGFEMLNGLLKKTQLSISLFHHGALTETAIALMHPHKALFAMGKTAVDAFKKKGKPAFANPELTEHAISRGVQIGASEDFPVQKIQEMLDNLVKKTKSPVPGTDLIPKLLASFNKGWDVGLWDYLHDGFKLYSFADAVSKIPKKYRTPEEIEKYEREQAAFINDTYGGQHWDVLMISPKKVQIMKWLLLSPDWTLSTIRQALSPLGVGRVYKENRALRAKTGAMFWVKAAMYFGVGMNALNYYFRQKDEEENPDLYPKEGLDFWDKTMWGNTIGHKSHLFVGRYEDGKERYVRWGKQFRELPELIMDDEGVSVPKPALKKIGGKASPLMQLGAQVTTGKTLSGYENYDMKDKRGWDWTLGALKTLAKAPVPFASSSLLRGDKEWKPTDLFMPSSKGMTESKAVDLFKKGISTDGGIDEAYIREVYFMAARNDLNAYSLFKTALTSVKATHTEQTTGDIKDLDDLVGKYNTLVEKSDTAASSMEAKKLLRKTKMMAKDINERKQLEELYNEVLVDLAEFQEDYKK